MTSPETNWTAAAPANLSATNADEDETRQGDQDDDTDDVDNVVRSGSRTNSEGGRSPEASPPTPPRKHRG